MNDYKEQIKRQQRAMDSRLNMNQLGGMLSTSQAAAAQQQEGSLRHQMWDDIQRLKLDVQQLQSAFNQINEFLKKAFPND